MGEIEGAKEKQELITGCRTGHWADIALTKRWMGETTQGLRNSQTTRDEGDLMVSSNTIY